jgi:ABC-type transport system substrate-binding protein
MLKSKFLILMVISAIAVLAAVACAADEAADPVAPQAAAAPADAAAPSGATGAPAAPKAARAADTPLPAQAAADAEAPKAADSGTTASTGKIQTRTGPAGSGPDLHDTQVVTSVGRFRSTMAPWRDGGGNRPFSTQVFGPPFLINQKGDVLPWIATGISSDDTLKVWTLKLREDAVFNDGTPITAADFKAYWEHGAKPENIVAWGGASLTLGDIKGWEELRAGDVIESEGLTVIDDQTLQVEVVIPLATWPLNMAAWHVGISKLSQVKADEDWGNAPIGAGPFSMTYDPDSGLTTLTRADLAGTSWAGPHETPFIEKFVLPTIPDRQVQVIMFENGELDVMSIDSNTYAAALNPNHPFNPLLYISPYGGLGFTKLKIDMAPLEDLLVRKALAHGQDMETIVKAVWGSTATRAKGLISSLIPCHNPDSDPQAYDPDLARQELSESTYGSGDNLPLLLIDLARPETIAMGVAMKEYWKDNLDVELDILRRESGMPRRESSQFYRISLGSWIPDPIQIVSNLTRKDSIEALSNIPGGYPIMDALVEYARSLPLDHPDRCAAFQAVEQEYLEKVYMIPFTEVQGVKWVVQPWLIGFESTSNLDFNTLTTAYIAKH